MNPKNIPDHIFRGYDLRGVVDEDLNEVMILKVTTSIGFVVIEKDGIHELVLNKDELEETMRNKYIPVADQALYESKEGGKNISKGKML